MFCCFIYNNSAVFIMFSCLVCYKVFLKDMEEKVGIKYENQYILKPNPDTVFYSWPIAPDLGHSDPRVLVLPPEMEL